MLGLFSFYIPLSTQSPYLNKIFSEAYYLERIIILLFGENIIWVALVGAVGKRAPELLTPYTSHPLHLSNPPHPHPHPSTTTVK